MKFKKLFFIFFIINLLINIIFCNLSYGIAFKADSPAVILFNSNTGKMLYEKNAYQKMYPASTTKIMTAILVLENCNLEDTTTVSANAIQLPEGYVGAYLQEGEVFTIKDLLYLLLLVSANDAANVLAEYVAGSINEFSIMMNNKAQEIGCLNTHFVNAYGAHNTNHYSTAYDLCLISNYAMRNDTFRQIVSTSTYTTPATNLYGERNLQNTNKLMHKTNPKTNTENIFYYEFTTGIKTGYTIEANNCLVASAKKDGVEYIVVILGAQKMEDDYNSQRYSDAKNLFTTAFDNYSLSTIKKSNDIITTVEIPNGDFIRKNLNLILENSIEFLIKNEDLGNELIPEVILYKDKIQAPISKGDILGTVTYTYEGISYTQNILAANDVATNEEMSNYFKIALGGLILLLSFTVFEIIRKK